MRWKKLTGNVGFRDILTLSNTYPLLLDSYSSCVLNNQATTSLNLCFLTRKDISAESMLQMWQYNFKPTSMRGLTTFLFLSIFWKGEGGINVHSRNFNAGYVGLHNYYFFPHKPMFYLTVIFCAEGSISLKHLYPSSNYIPQTYISLKGLYPSRVCIPQGSISLKDLYPSRVYNP